MKLKPVFERVQTLERLWQHQIDRIKVRAEAIARQAEKSKDDSSKSQER